MENDISSCFRVLSVQSHVVSGYVGNKSASFPLQVLGFDVDFINSVQLSNHTGYKHIKGQRLNSEDLQQLYDGLKLNNLTSYTHILTGYVGTETFLCKLVDIIQDLKQMHPSVYYVCDPVMGDDDQMYVPEELLPIYRDCLIPLANLVTPNQYETKLLTGITIKSKEDAIEAMNAFHNKGVETVVISSVEFESRDKLHMFGSSIRGGQKHMVAMDIPKLSRKFTGTGDVFSALLLAWMEKTRGNLKVSCEETVNTVYSMLLRTSKYANAFKDPSSPYALELKLIQSKKDIESPPKELQCYEL